MADATRTSKRPRTANPEGAEHSALVAVPAAASDAPPPRSSLPSPSLLLEGGHTALVLGLAFSHDGSTLATCSKDKTVCACATRARARAAARTHAATLLSTPTNNTHSAKTQPCGTTAAAAPTR